MSGQESLAWPPLAEDLRRLYLDERLSASKIAKAYGLKYASEKTAESTILYHLKKNGISRRDPAAHIRKVTEEMVDEWVVRYQKGESLKQIAGEAVDPVTVFNHLHKRGLLLRDKVEAQIKAVKKFDKLPFDGSAVDRAYWLGFVRGDLAVSRHGRAIRVKTTSTHPAMIELVLSLILPYGPARVYSKFSELMGYEWTVEGELDATFEFLLVEKDTPPSLHSPRAVILAYLAGLFDSEGSTWLRGDRRFEPRVSYTNSDPTMLDWIRASLLLLGFHSHLGNPNKRGVSQIQMWRTDEVLKFLTVIPFRHPEKKAKVRLMLHNWRSWSELHELWSRLDQTLDSDRREFVELAADEIRTMSIERSARTC